MVRVLRVLRVLLGGLNGNYGLFSSKIEFISGRARINCRLLIIRSLVAVLICERILLYGLFDLAVR